MEIDPLNFSAISMSFPVWVNFSNDNLLAALQTCQGRVDIRWRVSRPIRTRYEWCLVRSCHVPRSAITLEWRCDTSPPVPCDNMLRLFTLIYMRVHRDSALAVAAVVHTSPTISLASPAAVYYCISNSSWCVIACIFTTNVQQF